MRDDSYWWNLKDRAKTRAFNHCEWCRLRHVNVLHHRHYETKYVERLHDVMALCHACHRMIHGLWPLDHAICVIENSLATLGDDGFGMNQLWLNYLAHPSKPPKVRIEKNPDFVPSGSWFDEFNLESVRHVIDIRRIRRDFYGNFIVGELETRRIR
jgi:hypothetical protein